MSLDLRLPAGWVLHPDFAPRLEAATTAARAAGIEGARVGLVLGSGLGNVLEAMEERAAIGFAQIPGFHASTVQGHAGRLVQARCEGVDVVVLQGRLHAYEGLEMGDVVLPTALLCALGVRTVVLTNAAGGLHPDMVAGDLMAITDLVDLHLSDAGRGVLRAEPGVDVELAGRAARAGRLFDPVLARRLVEVGAERQVPMRTGTYASLWGPNYETPLEIGFLRRIGADGVGMSTGPEAAIARALGAKVAGVSCITNVAVEHGGGEVTHDEVMEVGAARRGDLATLLLGALGVLDALAAEEEGR